MLWDLGINISVRVPKVILWSTAMGQEILALDTETSPMRALTFSPDGTTLIAAGGWDEATHPPKLLIWRMGTTDAAKVRED